jgi:sugar phosphate isomerase/epimerase
VAQLKLLGGKMGCYLSTSCYKKKSIEDAINACGLLSDKVVELSAPHPHQPVEEISAILKSFQRKGYCFTLHNYFPPPEKSFVLNMASDDIEASDKSKALVHDAMQLCEAAGSNVYGIHAGYLARATAGEDGMFNFADQEASYEDSLERATIFVNEMNSGFMGKGVTFLIENLFPGRSRKTSLFCSLDEIRDFMSKVPDSVGLLLDLGHLNISSTIMGFDRKTFLEDYLDEFGERVHEVHISENNGLKDEHLHLKPNSWQLDAIKEIQKISVEKDGERYYCLEARNTTEEKLKESLSLINEVLA